MGSKFQFNWTKQLHKLVSKKNGATTSGTENNTIGFMASKSGGGIRRKILYECCKDDYDDDDCEDFTEE